MQNKISFRYAHGEAVHFNKKSGVVLSQNNSVSSYVRIARVNDEDSIFRFYAVIEDSVPAGKASAVKKLCVRTSLMSEAASFSFDWDQAAVSSRISTLYHTGTLSEGIVEEMIVRALKAADQLYPAFLLVLQKNDCKSAFDLFNRAANPNELRRMG